MAKKQTDKVVGQLIKDLKTAVSDLGSRRLEAALTIHKARHTINWGMTEYKFWKNFCAQEIPNMTQVKINTYRAVGANIIKYGYSDAECQYILDHISWDRFMRGLIHSKRKLSAKGFVRKYRNFMLRRSENGGDGRMYSFVLPEKTAEIFDGYLSMLGMVVGPHNRRTGMTDAIIQFIENFDKKRRKR
jgi:hypothetical protein